MTGKKQIEREAGETPTLIVFGLDETKRPHASAFSTRQGELAEKAAGLMGMTALRLATDEQKALAAKLPKGRVFASGRAFVPFVRAGLYEAIVAAAAGVLAKTAPSACAASADSPKADAGSGPPAGAAKPATPPQPAGWADIRVGSVVLATAGPDQGWYESEVIEILDDLLKLRWRSWPEEPVFARRFSQVGLLPPNGTI
ncbi:hypothetical protein [Methylocystis sp. SB2]|uniref:hypothetical protein n=1 Tax=Methylocystis sp. (strain SB2) TaxID=743836 RepID=UPI0004043CA8|nr:hypothetical protein [Methylocystis sp. SB2]